MKVLSLFDGMSCGQIALKELGIIPEVYYASEIDKNAIAMTMYNFPNTVQLGNVMKVDARKLGHIDLLIGGSPCFAAGTKVLTKDGYKNIEDVKIGDMVLTHTGKYQVVTESRCTGIRNIWIVNINDKTTYVTGNHKYYVQHSDGRVEWVAVEEIDLESDKVFEMVSDNVFEWVSVDDISQTDRLDNVYDICVDVDHSFVANGVVVHNCTNFSFAGRRNGMNTKGGEDNETIEIYTLEHYLKLKEEGFQFDGESFLFWEYMRILGELRETNPNVLFFLENVEMCEKWESCLTKAIGIRGVHINSALVSAQTRKRIYWTNIRTKTEGLFGWIEPDIPQPKDRGILLQDVLEDNVDEKYYLKQEVVDKLLGAVCNEDKKSDSPKAEEAVDNITIPDDEGEDVYNGKPLEGNGPDWTEDVHP